MKIVIDISEADAYGIAPSLVYKRLYTEYWEQQQKKYGDYFWSMASACDNATRELYSKITNRQPNIKSLILTYTDAERCFELFKQFADVWIKNVIAEKESHEGYVRKVF